MVHSTVWGFAGASSNVSECYRKNKHIQRIVKGIQPEDCVQMHRVEESLGVTVEIET